MESVKLLRYLLLFVALLCMFLNLVDCLSEGASLFEYIFYVGTLLLFALSLILVERNIVITITLLIAGLLTIGDHHTDGSTSGGIFFLTEGLGLLNNKKVNVLIYFATFLILVVTYVKSERTIPDVLNILLFYAMCFVVGYLTRQRGVN